MPQTRPLFEQLDSWLQGLDITKSAAAKAKAKSKKAGATKKAEPGESSHVSEDVDDNTIPAETGERYEENSSDVTETVPGQAVDEAGEDVGSQDEVQFNIGVNASATGEDPSVEDDYKGDTEDPGTSHPANAETTGEKYGSMSLKKLIKLAEVRANDILADLYHGMTATQKSAATPAQPAKPAQTAPTQPAAQPQQESMFDLGLDKIAAEYVAQTIADADLDADLTGSYLLSYADGLRKAAEGEEAPPEEEEEAPAETTDGVPPEGEGGVIPPEMMGGAPEGGTPDLMSLLGAGGAGEGPPPGAEGGEPPMDMPPEAGPGGQDPVSEEQAVQELAMALAELGIDPAQLAAEAPGHGEKLANAVHSFKRAGRFRFEEAKSAAQRQTREQIKGYILELTGGR